MGVKWGVFLLFLPSHLFHLVLWTAVLSAGNKLFYRRLRMKRWQPRSYQRVLKACAGSLASPWLLWSSGLQRRRPGALRRIKRRTRGPWKCPVLAPTWRPENNCPGFSGTSRREWWEYLWKTLTLFTSRTRE